MQLIFGKGSRIHDGEIIVYSTTSAEKTGYLHNNNNKKKEIGILFYTLQKNQFKVD